MRVLVDFDHKDAYQVWPDIDGDYDLMRVTDDNGELLEKMERDMSKPKVRFILESYASRSDVNGNRYWWHRLTSTKTGVSLRFEACHESNAQMIVDKATGARCFPEVHQITVTEVPIRQHNRDWKSCPFNEANHEALYAAIRELEK